MNIVGILSTIKGKVLDAASFEFLQNAYEMQNKNIEQLSNNNEALKESNELLKEKNNALKEENAELKNRIATIESELRMVSMPRESSHVLSEVAKNILKQCIKSDTTDFADEYMMHSLSHTRVEIEAAFDELEQVELIFQNYDVLGEGSHALTPKGKKVALKI